MGSGVGVEKYTLTKLPSTGVEFHSQWGKSSPVAGLRKYTDDLALTIRPDSLEGYSGFYQKIFQSGLQI